jgi:ribonuclease HI
MLGPSTEVRIPNYSCEKTEGHFNRRSHGGVALYIHESVPYSPIELNTPLQAVAINAQLHKPMTICSIYNSRSHELTSANLINLFNQLPQPVMILGDLNGYNRLWGGQTTDARGKIIENFLNTTNLNFLNTGLPTRISHTSETAIDLSIISPQLQPDCDWQVFPSPRDSDHCPIIVTILNDQQTDAQTPIRNYKRADWKTYKTSKAWNNIPEDVSDQQPTQLLSDFYDRINFAADESIPNITFGKFFPKPWWNAELTRTFNAREEAYKRYRNRKSPQNLVIWKMRRAEHRYASLNNKKSSWKELTNDINQDTPMGKVWGIVRKIKGRAPRKIQILYEGNQRFTTVPQICNKLADAFSKVAKNTNYSPDFQIIKTKTERAPLNLQSTNQEPYNQLFTLQELKSAITRSKNTSPGPDCITNDMLKNLPDIATQYLLKIMNKFYTKETFPDNWRESIIVPVPKPNKDHSQPINYRPIALTSVICKTMEKIINNRLLDYLDSTPTFRNIQAGGLRKRSTTDHLVRLESAIRGAFVNSEHLISIFFDLEKAYDTTWRYGIMRDLANLGLRGRLPKFINNFLQHRNFKVRLNNIFSNQNILETGIPQGSVLSVTLFIIKINNIAKLIPNDNRFHASLYVDDLQLSYAHQDINVIKNKLQTTVNTISKWATENGFKFSVAKTNAMHFCTLPGIHNSPTLRLNGSIIPYNDNIRFLGLVFDRKLTWAPHISQLKANCQRNLGLLRSLTSTTWGADQEILMHLYRALIRSKLDYAAIVYHSANKTTLEQLNTIPAEAIRIASGAFKSSPVSSLQVLMNEPPLELRRELSTLKYYYKMRSQLSNPAFVHTIRPLQKLLYTNKRVTPPISIRSDKLIEKYNLKKGFIKPNLSYKILKIDKPTWQLEQIDVCLELSVLPKKTTPERLYRLSFNQIMTDNNYDSLENIYTDGSKTDNGVGAAAVWGDVVKIATLPKEASIFSAELYAITLAITIISDNPTKNFVIFSDSYSALQKFPFNEYHNPFIRKMQHDIDSLRERGQSVKLCWIPGHAGIPGNETADSAAKRATNGIPTLISVLYGDYHAAAKEAVSEEWRRRWDDSKGKLWEVRPSVGPWRRFRGGRRTDQVKLNRLRIGHTLFTHGYLMENVQQPPPPCDFCYNTVISVKHVLTECPALDNTRQQLFGKPKPSIKSMLGDNETPNTNLTNFFSTINLYDQI